MELILITFLSYRNGVRAKRKGQNAVLWALATVGAYLLCMSIGLLVVMNYFCKGAIDINQIATADLKTREALVQQWMQLLYTNTLNIITVELFGIGGYLLVRFILEKKPGKPQQKIPETSVNSD